MSESFIPTEVKVIENSYSYLNGIGYNPQESFTIINYSIELQKVNMQARMIAHSEEINNEMIQRVAERVVALLKERKSRSGD